jgi:hypothetical protein
VLKGEKMRLIDADAFSDFIKKTVHEHGYEARRICDALTVGDVLNSVCAELDGTALEGFKNAPTVDAVPVVRCRDCKRYQNEVGDDEYAIGWCPFITINLVSRNDFCTWGKRKEDGNAAD